MYRWTDRDDAGPDYMRRVAMLSYDILRVREPHAVWSRLGETVATLLETTGLRGFDLDAGLASPVVEVGATRLPPAALAMEAALMPRALEAGRSLISNHPRLDPALRGLARDLDAEGAIVHALLLRADQRTHGVVAAHWVGTPRPGFERRAGFYIYGENAALAMAIAREREALRLTAFVDALTGLPDGRALEAEITRHAGTEPLGVLVLDFDGMRAANAAFENDYARGGDVLIVAVASALRAFAGPGELPARMHTRGDEFCLILPGSDAEATAARCERLQQLLTDLDVPETHRHVYRGASVGAASRTPGEPVAETLARASRAMHERKRATRSR
jgi:diguanylate cyclase (GGDEF)-like protein